MRNSGKEGYIKGLKKHTNIVLSILILILSFFMIMPVILILSVSFSSERSIAQNGYSFIPSELSLDAYIFIFRNSGNIIRSFGFSFIITVIGTILSLALISSMAYVLSNKSFRLNKLYIWLIVIPMFFSGGLAASYAVNTQFFGLKNSALALILPGACSSWYIIVMRTYFMKNIPEDVLEAARVDGASSYRIFLQFVLPMSRPMLLTVGIFEAFAYWNSWYDNLIYTDSAHSELYMLQYILYNMEKSATYAAFNDNLTGAVARNIPTESLRMALASVIILPIIAIYPFFRKHFVRGLTEGAGK